MARTKRSAKLDTWTARKKLKTGQMHQERVGHGQYIAYRRPKIGGAGTWIARHWNEGDKKTVQTRLGTADDIQDANGDQILSYAQAFEMAIRWFQAKLRQGSTEDDAEIQHKRRFTVKDALDAYFQHGEMKGLKSIKQSAHCAKAQILPQLGHIEVSRLTRIRIETWRDEMAQSPRLLKTKTGMPQNYAPPPATDDEKRARKVTANRVLALLRAALTQAADRGLIDVMDKPWQQVKAYKGASKSRMRFLSHDEQKKLVKACPPDFKELVRGALLTGCRFMELVNLKVKDCDPANGTIFISDSKSGKPRHIYLNEEGKKLFEELTAKQQPESHIFACTRKTNGNANGKTKGSGPERGPWTSSLQIPLMNEAWRAAKIPKVTFHELRHTYASTLVNQGCSLYVVAHQLGHADTRMVEKYYGHLAPNTVRAEVMRTMPVLGIV
jgi:integrase